MGTLSCTLFLDGLKLCVCVVPMLVQDVGQLPSFLAEVALLPDSLIEKLEEEVVVVVFTRENRGGSAQHATRATPIRSSHRPMRA